MRIMHKYVLYIVLLVSMVSISSGGLFGPDPVVSNDTWTPMDKCWAFDSYNSADSYYYANGIHYYVAYVNQNGQHKIENVDIDTWYNTKISLTGPQGSWDMYYQGAA